MPRVLPERLEFLWKHANESKIKKINRWHPTLWAHSSPPQLLLLRLESTCCRTREWNISKNVFITQMSHRSNRAPTCSDGQWGCSDLLIPVQHWKARWSTVQSCGEDSCQTGKASPYLDASVWYGLGVHSFSLIRVFLSAFGPKHSSANNATKHVTQRSCVVGQAFIISRTSHIF